MTISDKTRKLLWGKSGNRCAMCKHELSIDSTEKDDESLIGDECHIISGKEFGPRHYEKYDVDNLDSYDNLILLCRVHHKQIDDQSATFTADILRQMKNDHEKWISDKLKGGEKQFKISIKRLKENIQMYLPRIANGQDLLNIILNADSFQFYNDELNSAEEVKMIGQFLDLINDSGMILDELDPSCRLEAEFSLTKQIKGLDEAGFWVFGAREKQRLETSEGNDDWTMATFQIIRKTNEEILKI